MKMGYTKKNLNLRHAFETIRASVPDAKEGLGLEIFHFISSLTPMVNVDLLVKNLSGQTLLTWRSDKFYGPGWHLPGGVVRFKEDPTTRVVKVALDELGCTVDFDPTPLVARSQTTKERDVRGHFISLLYKCKLTSDPDVDNKARIELPQNGQWYWHDFAPVNLLPVHESFRDLINAKR